MPNWCSNSLTLTHTDPAMIDKAVQAFTDGKLLETFVPYEGEWDYDWCVSNWGTKWDVGGDNGYTRPNPNTLNISFESAWAPPTVAYSRLEELGFTVKAMYYEPGMCFCGLYEDGNDDYYEYDNMDAAELADTLPTELDEEFGISDQLAEWEAEQEEDNE
jgi:hypothetical protein